MNEEKEMTPADPEVIEATRIAAANAVRESARERAYIGRFDGKDVKMETIRGVTLPIEPGSSRLRIEVERKKALKRMRGDDKNLARIQRAIDDQNRSR